MTTKIRAAFVALCVVVLPGFAQEFDPHDPAIISDRLNRANAVVIGDFKVDWCLPWFDGWRCSGAVHIAESLRGDWRSSQLVPFRWKERYGSACLICEKVSQFHSHKGIWFLTKTNDTWQFTPTVAFLCGDPFSMNDRDTVLNLIRQKDGK